MTNLNHETPTTTTTNTNKHLSSTHHRRGDHNSILILFLLALCGISVLRLIQMESKLRVIPVHYGGTGKSDGRGMMNNRYDHSLKRGDLGLVIPPWEEGGTGKSDGRGMMYNRYDHSFWEKGYDTIGEDEEKEEKEEKEDDGDNDEDDDEEEEEEEEEDDNDDDDDDDDHDDDEEEKDKDDDDDDDDDEEEKEEAWKPNTMNDKVNDYKDDNKKKLSTTEAVVVAYVVSLTGCPTDPTTLIDAALVLQHSIHLHSVRSTSGSKTSSYSNKSVSRYDYKTYAIVHPSAKHCSEPLQKAGYEILIRDVPVSVSDIQGDFLRDNVEKNGCCGEKEYLKLWAYTLIEHEIVVHLDFDTLLMDNLDVLFDAMLLRGGNDGDGTNDNPNKLITVTPESLDAMWPNEPLPTRIDAYFTRDYNMIKPGREHVGVQGGFLILRPSMTTFELYKSTIIKGDFGGGKGGWGGKGYGPFYGSLTFQGIVPYIYGELLPNTSVELNRCVYNAMVDNPKDQKTKADNIAKGKCKDGRQDCEDCRLRKVDELKTVHFTLCQKPWECLAHDNNRIQEWLCRDMFAEWYRVREDLMDGNRGVGRYQHEHFRGYCKKSGSQGYIPITKTTKN